MKKETLLLIQGMAVAIGAWLSDHLGLLYPTLMLLIGMMIMDYISGMAASKKEAVEDPNNLDKGWSSEKGWHGIFKKVGYLLVIGVAMAVDWLIFRTTESMGIQMPASTFFGLVTTVWFILNELLSILENAGRMGAPLPEFLRQAIAVLKTSVEHQGSGQIGKE